MAAQFVVFVCVCGSFSRAFSTFSDVPAEEVTLEKHVHALFQPEPNYWFVLVAENSAAPDAADPTRLQHDERSALTGSLAPLVERAYASFRLFNGPLADIVSAHGPDGLRAGAFVCLLCVCCLNRSRWTHPHHICVLNSVASFAFVVCDVTRSSSRQCV